MPVPLSRLAQRHLRAAQWLWRAWCEVAVWHSPMAVMADAVSNGADVVVVCGVEDVADMRAGLYWRTIGRRRLERTGRFRFVVDPIVDHGLGNGQGRRATVDLLNRHVFDRYAPDPD